MNLIREEHDDTLSQTNINISVVYTCIQNEFISLYVENPVEIYRQIM